MDSIYWRLDSCSGFCGRCWPPSGSERRLTNHSSRRLRRGLTRALGARVSAWAAPAAASTPRVGSSAGSGLVAHRLRRSRPSSRFSGRPERSCRRVDRVGSGFGHSPWSLGRFRGAARATRLRKQRRLGRLLRGLRRHSVRLTNRSSRPRSMALFNVVVDWAFSSSRSARCGSA